MPLGKQNFSVPFAAGVDTKSDENQLQFNGLTVLENAVFETPGRLLKRNGYTGVTRQLLDGTDIENGKSLANFEDELAILSSTNYYSFSESLNKWSDKGRVFTAFPESKTIVRNDRGQFNLDALTVENLTIYSYEDEEGCYVTVVDNVNNSFLASNLLVTDSGTNPRLANIENDIHILFIDGVDLKFRRLNLIKPTELTAEITLASNVETTDRKLDCVNISDRVYFAYNSSDMSSQIKVGYLESGAASPNILGITGEDANSALSISGDAENRVMVSWSDGSDVKMIVYNRNLGLELLSTTVIESRANVVNITLIEDTSSPVTYKAFYEESAASSINHKVYQASITLAGSVSGIEIIARSVGLASKPFKYQDSIYVLVVHASELQSTYFLISENKEIISKVSPGLGGDLVTGNSLSKTNILEDSKFLFATQIKGRTTIDDDEFFSLLGVNSTVVDFEPQDPLQNDSLGFNLHIAGGILMMYDGATVVEHGFHLFPENLEVQASSNTGGVLSDGTYQYSAVYAWTDNKGQIHRSAASVGLEVELSAGTSTQQRTIRIPTLRLTQKQNVIIELYRTEANGTIFYKITDTSNPVKNDKTVDFVDIVDDSTSDADLIDNEVLYTTGGVLENIAASSSRIVEPLSDRLFLAGLEDPNKLQYSKIRFEGSPVEFNDILTIQVNSRGGEITALKAMDDKLVIFKESALFYLSGDGPNNLGQQDTFIKPELVSSEIGCINSKSVVLTPDGIMFKSRKGIYLLSRSLQLEYIGDNVEDFNDLRISSAIVVPEENQVRFTTETGDALIYNYFFRQWSTFTNHQALSAVGILFDYYYLRSDGILFKESETQFTDNGSPINLKLESGWISFAQVQGFQRVYKLLLLGNFKSPHKLRIRVAYDFNEAFVQEKIIDTADFTDNARYGDDSPYGLPDTKAYGGSGNVHQIRLNLKRQKCQSMKIRIEEIQNDLDNLGEGLTLSNIMLEVGQKAGTAKLDNVRKYGTE